MKALQYISANKVEVRDVPIIPLAPGQARIRVTYCGVCGSDISEERLKLCEEFGFETVNSQNKNLAEYVANTTRGEGVNIVYECSGARAGAEEMTYPVCTDGMICLVGVHKEARSVALSDMHFRELNMTATRVYEKEEFRQTVEYIEKLQGEIGRMITDIVPLEKSENVFEYIADLGDAKQRVYAFDEAMSIMGGLDILVNCAGIQRRHPVEDFPMEDWDDVIATNLTAAFHLSQLAAREYLKKEKPYGKIINVASMLSFFGGNTVVAYAAAKGGIAQMTKAFCNELASKGINVNAIAPGYMDTELNRALTDPANPRFKEITDRIPAGRWGDAEDMNGATVFLASAASDYVNGAIIPVDGGYLVK